jgi:hypothetical protein
VDISSCLNHPSNGTAELAEVLREFRRGAMQLYASLGT